MSDMPNFRENQQDDGDLAEQYDATLKRLIVPYESLTVDTRFGSTHLLVAGSFNSPPILMLHGMGSHAGGCWPLINSLARDYRIYAPDAPRHLGKSEPFRLSSRGDDYGMWLTDILDAFEVERVNLVGFSLGGWMVLKLATFAPERIIKVVLLSPIGVEHFRIEYLLRAPFYLLRMMIHPTKESIQKFVRIVAGPTASSSAVEEITEAGLTFIRHFRMPGFPYRPSKRVLQNLEAPALVLMGQHDAFCEPRKVLTRLDRHMPNVVSEIIPGIGHVLYLEKPALVNQKIITFLREDPNIQP
jgi:pimeloyl-ACP methyl ester carboxylesterase